MKDLMPARVETAGGKQNEQAKLRTLEDVPARYRTHPGFEQLTIDPAHKGNPIPKTIREAMTAVEAELSGAVKGPVSRSDSPYIDFYDGEGHPMDVKTPLSPARNDKWEFDYVTNANTILAQLDKDHPNKLSGEKEPVTVLLDTTYMSPADHTELWRELRRQTKENRSVLKNITEVNVALNPLPARFLAVNAALMKKNLGR